MDTLVKNTELSSEFILNSLQSPIIVINSAKKTIIYCNNAAEIFFETSRKRQRLFNWRAQLLTPEDFRNGGLPVLSTTKILPSRDSFSARRLSDRRKRRSSALDCTESLEDNEASADLGGRSGRYPCEPDLRNESANPPEGSALSE